MENTADSKDASEQSPKTQESELDENTKRLHASYCGSFRLYL